MATFSDFVYLALDRSQRIGTEHRVAQLGIIFGDRGNRMSPTHGQKKGWIRYRYYTSCVMAQGRKAEAGSLPRASAPAIESLVLDALRSKHLKAETERDLIRGNVARVEVRAR